MERFTALAFALVTVACAAESPSRPPGAPPAPTAPLAWRIETVFYDVPLAVAERFHHPADPDNAALAPPFVDEKRVQAQLFELSRTAGSGVERAVRPVIVVPDGERVLLSPRTDIASRPMGSLASDWLQIHVGARGGHDWASCSLLFDVEWTARSPQRVAGDTPQPEGYFLEIVHMPAGRSNEHLAAFAFLRAHPAGDP